MQAAVIGESCQSAEWCEKLHDSFGTCVDESIELAATFPHRGRVEMLENYVAVVVEDSRKPDLFLELATVLFHAGLNALTTKKSLVVRALRPA